MVHMGGAAFNDLSHAAIEVAEKYQNIILIGSAIRDISIFNALKLLAQKEFVLEVILHLLSCMLR